MLPTVSLIVPAKNEEKVIRSCIESLLSLDYPKDKLEVIVSIDDSTDSTLDICKGYEPKIKVIESSPKKCKAEAINEVLPLAKGRIIGIYDADCIVDKNCLKEVMKHFSDKKIAGVSGAVKSISNNTLSKTISLETCFTSFLEHFLSRFGANSHFTGKNMFIRKSVLEKLKGFDEHSFLEDIELSLRMKRLKYKVVFEPKAITWQKEPENLSSFIKQRVRWSRGIIRIKKLKRQNSLKTWLSDLMHGIPYYLSPFGMIIGTILAVILFLNLPWLFVLPLLLLFSFNIITLVYSRIFYKEPIRYLIYLPFWFVLSNIYSLILTPKAYFDEKRGKEIVW